MYQAISQVCPVCSPVRRGFECNRDFSPIDLAQSIPELPFHGGSLLSWAQYFLNFLGILYPPGFGCLGGKLDFFNSHEI